MVAAAAHDDGHGSTDRRFEVVVFRATPGGIAAAIAAARLGRSVALIEYHPHVGGMASSGLGKSDIENRAMIAGLFAEFTNLILAYYADRYGADSENVALCQGGYFYEPSVAESVFEQMLADAGAISVLKGWHLDWAVATDGSVRAVRIIQRDGGDMHTLRADVFIDASYEGDLYASAGARFRLGREARDEFDEPHAGFVYFDYQNRKFLPGTTGAGDDALPASTYRLCLTTDPDNAHRMSGPPPGFDRTDFVGYFDDLAAGRLAGPKVVKRGRGYNPAHFDTLVRALSVSDIPNAKTDVNINPRPLGSPFPEENQGYIEGGDDARQKIATRHRALATGLLWFLQNDEEVPAAHREIANTYHWPLDEFTDNGHFPFQLYVREGRRLVGCFTLSERHITGTGQDRAWVQRQPDSIAVGEFPIDSFPCHKRQADDTVVLEGYLGMLDFITRPYEIPYRIMIPETVDGLIVPVAASTTHVAYSSIRMEPTWMALGQAAGVAAHLALRDGVAPRGIAVAELQRTLKSQGQVTEHP